MSSSCVHDCRHPLWGGTGTCHDDVGDTDDAICECDPSYAPRDAWGNASCVPRLVLVSTYVFLATMSVLVGALVVWDINRHRRLPVRYQISRKMVIRTRALLSSSVYLFGYAILGVVLALRAGETGYADLAIWQAQYILFISPLHFGVAMMAGYWLQSLPSQVVSPDSFTGLLRHASDNTTFFMAIGLANAAPVFTLGILAFFFDKWLMLVGDLAIIAEIICAVIVVLFVAVRTTGAINLAMGKGSASSRAFYAKAKKNLWLQAAALCGTGVAGLAVTTVKQLLPAGRHTPVFSFTAQIMCSHAAVVVFTLATKQDAPSPTAGGHLADDPAKSNVVLSTPTRAATALSSVGAAVHDLLLRGRSNPLKKPQGGLVEATAKVVPDEKHEPRPSRACGDTSRDEPAQPVTTTSSAGG